MLGCRYNAKNTLDKNYLYLAQQLGCEILAESEVIDIKPIGEKGQHGYNVVYKKTSAYFGRKKQLRTKKVIFAGGVLGTMKLLLQLKESSLPNLSPMLGYGVRTNSESLIGVTSFDKAKDFSKGIAIGSLVNIDENRHVEPVKYSKGSGFWRIFMSPMVSGKSFVGRLFNIIKDLITHPVRNFKAFFIDDWSKRTHILLYMESIDSTLRMKRSSLFGSKTELSAGEAPTAFNPIAQEIARKTEKIVNGKAMVMSHETLFGIPSTAHILGGACMGANAAEGVIDANNSVFNYDNLMVCDGSMISANIGVNPSLSITAITERAMAKIPPKNQPK